VKKSNVVEKPSLAGMEWVTPEQAAVRLNRSVRRVLEYAAEGTLVSARQEDPVAKRQKVVVSGNDVERLLAEMQNPKPREKQLRIARSRASAEVATVQAPVAVPEKPPAPRSWMTLHEASEASGLSRKLLYELIRDGELPAREDHVKADRWRIHREDLEGLRGQRRK
jgi:excisionase family DNA binding protein